MATVCVLIRLKTAQDVRVMISWKGGGKVILAVLTEV